MIADPEQLNAFYSSTPFSVHTMSRQVKYAAEKVKYSTIYSAFIFPLSGEAVFSFGDQSFSAHPGVILHGCPHKLLRCKVVGSCDFEHINIYYSACSMGGPEVVNPMKSAWLHEPQNYAELLQRVVALDDLGLYPSLNNRVNQIIGATNMIKGMFKSVAEKRPDEKALFVKNYIETHFFETITLSRLALLVNISESRLSHAFKESFGMCPINYLVAFRLERALQLLQSDMSIGEVSRAVGYEDPLYFSRIFKKKYGSSPSKARAGMVDSKQFQKRNRV